MIRRMQLWLRSNLLRRRLEREMREEMAGHLEQATARLRTRGLSDDDARRAAEREFGNVEYLRTEGRDARSTLWLDALAADCRFAVRQFSRRPMVTVLMLIILSVGMSISSLLFSWVHAYMSEPPPAVEYDRSLVRIRGSMALDGGERAVRTFSQEELDAYRGLTAHFSAVLGWVDAFAALVKPDDPERRGHRARVTFVTDGYFETLRVQPLLGPGLSSSDRDAVRSVTAVINHQAWQQLYGKDAAVIGSTVRVNGKTVTIVGVAPERFMGARGSSGLQIWMPIEAREFLAPKSLPEFRAFARLRPGVDAATAAAAVKTIAARTAPAAESDARETPSADVVTLLSANNDPMFERDVRLQVLSVGGLALLVLLVTCTNVSALLTGLASARRQEIAVRLSLGAARGRIIRQLLTESAALAVLAGVVAIGIVTSVLRAVMHFIPAMPVEVGTDWTITSFTFAVALGVGIVFGLSPALHATRLALADVLRDSAGGIAASRARLQRGLVVAQIAFTQPLIVGLAAVLVMVLGTMQPRVRSDSGDHVVAVRVQSLSSFDDGAVVGGPQDAVAMDALLQRVLSMPGVQSAVPTWVGGPDPERPDPVDEYGAHYVAHPGDAGAGPTAEPVELLAVRVGAEYFDVMDIPVLRGRVFDRSDGAAVRAPQSEIPTVISRRLAERVWGAAEPVGRRLQATGDSTVRARTLVVVGVVDDPISRTRSRSEPHGIYLPADVRRAPNELLVRTTTPAKPLLPAMRQILHAHEPGAIVDVRTLAEIAAGHERNVRLVSSGLSAAGLAALLLSAIGLYAVVAFSVAQRTREIAVRMAVGARTRQISNGFIGDGLRMSGLGLLLGMPGSVIALQAVIDYIGIQDVRVTTVVAIAAASVAVVAAASAWFPARRAAGVDPAVTLRTG